jgi:DNA-binding transcriptional LysR family regulator
MVRVSAPDAFTSVFLAPAMTALRREHPQLAVELLSATQRVRQNRSGVDLEIVVGRPQVLRAYATPVCAYALRLYATPDYLAGGVPDSIAELSGHPLVYYVESSLQVDELDRALQELPDSPRRSVRRACSRTSRRRPPERASASCPTSSATPTRASCACSTAPTRTPRLLGRRPRRGTAQPRRRRDPAGDHRAHRGGRTIGAR